MWGTWGTLAGCPISRALFAREVGDLPQPPAATCTRPRFCSKLAPHWGSASPEDHVSADRQILVVLRAGRSFRSACAGADCPAPTCLLPPHEPSLPGFGGGGIRAARGPRHRLLQSRLLPRRDHVAVGQSATLGHGRLRRKKSRQRRGIARNHPGQPASLIPIHPRSPANIPRLSAAIA